MPLDELLALYGYEPSDPISERESEGSGPAAHLLDMTLDKVRGSSRNGWEDSGTADTEWGGQAERAAGPSPRGPAFLLRLREAQGGGGGRGTLPTGWREADGDWPGELQLDGGEQSQLLSPLTESRVGVWREGLIPAADNQVPKWRK